MIKKILALVVLSLLVSCGSSYSSRRKNSTAKTNTSRKTKIATKRNTATANSNKGKKKQEVLESTSKTVVYADVVKQYVLDFEDIAKDNMRNHGIPASITLAQGILESGAGRGTLCVTANNHFGIKCHTGWEGEAVYHDDDAAQECFRKYNDPAESYNDHSLFLTTRGRYASLFKLDKDDYKAWAHGLKAAGYATDPKYPDKLIGIIERYELDRYDAEVLGNKYTPKPNTIENDNQVTQTSIGASSYRVEQGDTLYSISRKYNLSVDELKQLNGLTDNALSIGQILKVK
ncbi:LysM peptidoglycan-binding domain-containing protein [Flavobacterium salilacus subsp. salilacus]|uniref:glucosaminidase domain-containing protein n=1 Tax=Flavobacterium TaxID=237 RepID=UPI0010754BE3|nr:MULTISPECIES: glucosaminidase domain-containing protein [Flavobacterium]KAF2519557.1 LysM peptidoglycan-binding domain-containing protein [Flavobacterium salilacus subsp. salilacus]MBE1614544.1 glucosaminidase domain-containing protein [Flavobacterium sp. SaA2.13]